MKERTFTMPYVTLPQSPIYQQLTLEDILSGKASLKPIRTNETNTRTYFTDDPLGKFTGYDKLAALIAWLKAFTQRHAKLYEVDRHTLYRTFHIPKKSGGLREINAPEPELMCALIELRTFFEQECVALYHTSAYAYVQGRCTVDAVKKHQINNSRWFLKVDFHNFFGSTTKEFTMNTLAQISPFNLIIGSTSGQEVLSRALDLCFLDGGLPQGTPISPMLTNLLMIPVDFKLSNRLRDFNGQQFVYTRYADDMLISSFQSFSAKEVQDLIREVLHDCGAPYTFKEEKTRYGSRAGSNWNLGVMLNKDNNITVGHKNKKRFRAMLNSYVLDKKNGKNWELHDVQTLRGLLSYYTMIEKDYFEALIKSVNEKHNVNLSAMIKADLSL